MTAPDARRLYQLRVDGRLVVRDAETDADGREIERWSVSVPRRIEAAGGAAINAYVVKSLERRGHPQAAHVRARLKAEQAQNYERVADAEDLAWDLLEWENSRRSRDERGPARLRRPPEAGPLTQGEAQVRRLLLAYVNDDDFVVRTAARRAIRAVDAGDLWGALTTAIAFAARLQRLRPMALAGFTAAHGRRAGGHNRRIDDPTDAQIRRAVQKCRDDHPSWKCGRVCKRVADDFRKDGRKISYRTIMRRVESWGLVW